MSKKLCRGLGLKGIRALGCLVLSTVLFTPAAARADAPPVTTPTAAPSVAVPANASPEMTEFLQNRAALLTKLEQLQANGSSDPQAMALFQQQNADLLKRQAQLAQVLAQQQKTALPAPTPLPIPADASPQMKAFLAARDQLMRDEIAFQNQHLNDDPATREAAAQQWQQQKAARSQQIQQAAQAVSLQNAATPLPVPPPLQIPPDASPEMRALLTARDQLMRDEIAFKNQHANDDGPTRAAALQQWQQQNAARFQQVQQLAKALPGTN